MGLGLVVFVYLLKPVSKSRALEATQSTPRRKGRREYFKIKRFCFLCVLCASATQRRGTEGILRQSLGSSRLYARMHSSRPTRDPVLAWDRVHDDAGSTCLVRADGGQLAERYF